MTAGRAIPLGYRCECGTFHDFPAYVFAHWKDTITHTCENCSRRHDINQGEVTLLERRAKTK